MTKYNLAALLENSALEYRDRTAIVLDRSHLTYGQVNAAANQVANLLSSRGIGAGDTVAVMMPNIPQFTVIYYGILKAGAAVVPLNILLKSKEVAYHLADSGARVLFAFEGTAELPIGREAQAALTGSAKTEHLFVITADPDALSPIEGSESFARAVANQPVTFDTAATDEDDTAVILYTSGTTGQPKGAQLRHRNMRDNALPCHHLFGVRADTPDTFLSVLPLFHSFGQTAIQNCAIAFGGTIVMLPRFDAEAALDIMLAESVSFFAGVPTMYWGLLGALDESFDVGRLAGNLRVCLA